jgi:hypothetical protein
MCGQAFNHYGVSFGAGDRCVLTASCNFFTAWSTSCRNRLPNFSISGSTFALKRWISASASWTGFGRSWTRKCASSEDRAEGSDPADDCFSLAQIGSGAIMRLSNNTITVLIHPPLPSLSALHDVSPQPMLYRTVGSCGSPSGKWATAVRRSKRNGWKRWAAPVSPLMC